MVPLKKIIILFLGLAAAGLIKMPFEHDFTMRLRERNLAPPSISVEMWSRMGQSSLAGTFGGLRSALAFFTSLSAHGHFEDQEWHELKKDYELITALDPYNPFYWQQGAGHLAYNAASWARSQRKQPEIQRKTIEMEYLEAGDAFLKEGLRYLPENADLWAEIARIWSHSLKRPDYPRAAEAWQKAAELSDNQVYHRRYFYTLAQIPGREKDALEEGIRLAEQNPDVIRIPSFRAILWTLYQNPALPLDMRKPTLVQLFGSKKKAYRDLYNHRYRIQDDGFYEGNIDADLRQLIIDLKVPFELNPFLSPRQRRIPNDW
ncbi:MAG: hypothetical protein ACSHYF_16385 [Verrucomicrobiaceae bacterium]